MEDLLSFDSKLKRKRKNYIVPGLITLCGVGVLFYAPQVQHLDSLMMFLFVLGISAIVLGVIKLFIPCKEVVSPTTKEIMKRHTIYFNRNEVDKVLNQYEKGNFEYLLNMTHTGGEPQRMATIYLTPSFSYAVAQMYEFVPYEYRPCSEPKVYQK